MSEAKNTNELDNYGVWVKNPPKTVDSSANENSSDFSVDTDLPDFSELDKPISNFEDNSISEAEYNAISSDGFSFDGEENAVSSDGVEEEISLDEFITDGIFETGPDEDKIAEKEAAATEKTEVQQSAAEDDREIENVSFDDSPSPIDDGFTVTEDSPEEEILQPSDSFASDDDDMLNIDLSFDDEPAKPSSEKSLSFDTVSEAQSDSPAGTEEVDLSEFGMDFGESEETAPAAAENPQVSDGGMESIDLSEFGFDSADDIQDSAKEETPAEKEDIPIPAAKEEPDENTEETVSLDGDFVSAENGGHESSDENSETFEPPEAPVFEETAETAEFEETSAEEPFEFSESPATDIFAAESINAAADANPCEVAEESEAETDESDVALEDFAESLKPPILEEMEQETEQPSSQMTAIFGQIVSELSALKDEIASLKHDLQDLKNNPPEQVEIPEQKTQNGFFSDSDEDETIALSSDEIDNILNSADFSSEKEETLDAAEAAGELSDEAKENRSEEAALEETETSDDDIFDEIIAEKTDDSAEIPSDAESAELAETPDEEVSAEEIETVDDDIFDEIIAEEAENDAEPSEEAENAELEETPVEENSAEHETIDDDIFDEIIAEENNGTDEQNEEPQVNEIEVADTPVEEFDDDILGKLDDEVDFPEEDFENESFAEETSAEDEAFEVPETIEEPSADDFDFQEQNETDVELPEEISVPKDIVVESSETDFIDGAALPEEKELSIEESLTEQKISYLEDDISAEELIEEPAQVSEEIENEPDIPAETVNDSEKTEISGELKTEIVSVLSYMDQLLENLPEEKIEEFAKSDQFDTYKKLFKKLGLN